jgi:hypothetical protein
MKIMGDFLPVAMKELKLKVLPDFKLVLRVPENEQPTFGKFVPDENKIYLAIDQRHPLDILRTLAHELVHFKQGIEHKLNPNSGKTGSPEENEAHEFAGIIMRNFNKTHPQYFNDRAIHFNETLSEASLGNMLPWPEVVNKINSAMKAMGWKGQRKDDGSFMFSTRGQLDDEFYIVIIDNEGDSMFTYALGTVEEGDPHIGEQDTLPTTEASVSELMNAIRDGFGLNENFADGKNPQDKGDSKRLGVPTKASVSTLRKVAHQGGRKGQLAHWMANMKAGKAKQK